MISSILLKALSTNNSLLSKPITSLSKSGKPTKTIEKLMEAGVETLEDLLWILPLRVQKVPAISSFNSMQVGKLFLGRGTKRHLKAYPAFGRKGKGRVQLFNITLLVQDSLSDELLSLRWFNSYPNIRKQLDQLDDFVFMGVVTENKGELSLTNPQINPIKLNENDVLIEYPTINGLAGRHLKSLLEKVPSEVWDEQESLPLPHPISLIDALKVIHGKKTDLSFEQAIERLKYQEFFSNQIKAMARKQKNQTLKAPKIVSQRMNEWKNIFPYKLTEDQEIVLDEISQDMTRGYPMMRMIQGDVGCGKTSVALLSALAVIESQMQVAFMCPTEALATQHFQTIKELLGSEVSLELLLGSTSAKDKKQIYKKLKNGEVNLIIGTHSLIQDAVEFDRLALAIIDEQHKFGVNQRLKLYSKGNGVHSLIMSATPIPRSLQLAQYGDLNISTIKTMPKGRKGVKTRIVDPSKMTQFLSFLKTRLTLKEQIYVVVPAIEDSEVLDINSVNELEKTYRNFFPQENIIALHGKLNSEEKQNIMRDFQEGRIDILISTTVIEVGINVLDSTVMAIYNPERFGLSTLHQLRGRVGRGEKPGFCFLVVEKELSDESRNRLKIIEETTDGFKISEADLEFRGQGDVFGVNQSGHQSGFRVANIFLDREIFEQVSKDIKFMQKDQTEKLNNLLLKEASKLHVSTTI